MRIALTVKGVGFGAWLDDDFAHCGFVMVVDDDNQFDSWKNPASEEQALPSQELTDFILQTNPDVLITGTITDSQKAALTAQEIKVLADRTGFVLELLEEARG
jgi:predicted Fe-Mo cluster-binding NifX family protein